MNPSKSQPIEWKFGDREESVEAWVRHPTELHMAIDFHAPDSRDGKWYRIMIVTAAWLRKHADESRLGGIWPALLIVPDGTRGEIETSIASQLKLGWRLLVQYAERLPKEPEPSDL
jgi:hypothetical protein